MMDAAQSFWAKLRRLVVPPGPPSPLPRPTPPFLAELRRTLADRGSDDAHALQRRVARLAADRVQAVVDAEFAAIFDRAEVGVIVREALTDLLDGGLASFRGRSDEDLVQFVEDRADRVLLRAAVAEWTDHEARIAWRARYGDLLSPAEADEIAAEAVDQLLHRALHGFRGGTAAELYGFARVVASRTVSRAARRRSKDRSSLAMLRVREAAEPDAAAAAAAVATTLGGLGGLGGGRAAFDAPAVLADADREYLEGLLATRGSRAELARRLGVGRSAVTRRVDRILARLDDLPDADREAVGRWARRTWAALEDARDELGLPS